MSFLYLRHRVRSGRRRLLAAQRGLTYIPHGLQEAPRALQATALFAAFDGGHERDVLSGSPVLADESVPMHLFSFRSQREIRGERAILMTRPPFAVAGSTTVITYELPRKLGHILVKRTGPSDHVLDVMVAAPDGITAVAREASGIDRVVRVEPPPGLGGDAIDVGAADGAYRAWAESHEHARAVFTADIGRYLCSQAAGTGEWVIEVLDDLLIVYCARDGDLSEDRILAMNEFTDELCRRILRATLTATPRGMEHRS